MNDFAKMTRILKNVKCGDRDCRLLSKLVSRYGFLGPSFDIIEVQNEIAKQTVEFIRRSLELPPEYSPKDPRSTQ